MKLLDRGFRDRQPRAPLVNKFERIAISAHFFFISVTKGSFAKDHRGDAGFVDFDAFDAVRRDCAIDKRVFTKHPELLRRLTGEQLLFASRFSEVGQIPSCPRGQRRRFGGK